MYATDVRQHHHLMPPGMEHNKPAPDATAASEWIDARLNTTVVNRSLVTDPTICPPGFNLPRRLWSTLNRFRTGHGRCAANLVR